MRLPAPPVITLPMHPARTPTAAFRRSMGSFRFALAGLAAAWRTQPNLRVHAAAAFLALALATALGFTDRPLPAWAWCALILSVAGVVSAELLNTAVEATLDHLAPGRHPAVKLAKDAAAAGVLVAATGAACVGGIVFVPRLLALLT